MFEKKEGVYPTLSTDRPATDKNADQSLSSIIKEYQKGHQKRRIGIHFKLHSRPKPQKNIYPVQVAINNELGLSQTSARPLVVRIWTGKDSANFFLRMPTGYTVSGGAINWEALTLDASQWDQSLQKVKGSTPTVGQVNDYLQSWTEEIKSIFASQQELAQKNLADSPTPHSVMQAFFISKFRRIKLAKLRPKQQASSVPVPPSLVANLTPETPLTDALAHYIVLLSRQNPKLSPKTLSKWEDSASYLRQYLAATDQQGISCAAIRVAWAKRFHAWLLSTPSIPGARKGKAVMSAGTASRHVLRLKALFIYLVEEGVFDRNLLADLRLPKDKTKAVYFLDGIQLQHLLLLEQPESEYGSALWWMKFMCLTGLDYPDALRYIKNRSRFEQAAGSLTKVVINRSKPPYNECHIYMLDEVQALLQQPPLTLHELKHDAINNYIRRNKVSERIGFTHPLTCKIARKTAGNYFVRKGFSIEAVSGILGHETTATTERHYVKITGAKVDIEAIELVLSNARPSVVDRDTERIAQANKTCQVRPFTGGANPFLRIA